MYKDVSREHVAPVPVPWDGTTDNDGVISQVSRPEFTQKYRFTILYSNSSERRGGRCQIGILEPNTGSKSCFYFFNGLLISSCPIPSLTCCSA
jgi:hypothetical protein